MNTRPPNGNEALPAKVAELTRERDEARHQVNQYLQASEEWRRLYDQAQDRATVLQQENKSLQFWGTIFFFAAVVAGLKVMARAR